MRTLIEGFAYVIVLVLIVLMSLEYILVNRQLNNAEEIFRDVEDALRLVGDNYEEIDKIKDEILDGDYVLEVTDKGDNYELRMSYDMEFGLLGISRKNVMESRVVKE